MKLFGAACGIAAVGTATASPPGAIVVGDVHYVVVDAGSGVAVELKPGLLLRDLAPLPDRRSFVASDAQWNERGGIVRVRWTGQGAVVTCLTRGDNFHPSVSWDGKELVYEKGHELWVRPLSGGVPRLLRGSPIRPTVVPSKDLHELSPIYDLAWSWNTWLPGDSGLLALYSQPPGGTAYELHYVPYHGRRFAGKPPQAAEIYTFNPAGNGLAWVDVKGRAWVAGWSRSKGRGLPKRVPTGACESVAWSPDGKQLAVAGIGGPEQVLSIWDLASGRVRQVAKLGKALDSSASMVWLRG
jgi:hypothetical protein